MKKLFAFVAAALFAGSMFADPNILAPTISGDTEFTDSVIVTMDCASPNSDIYYTIDGTTDPKCDCAAAPEYKRNETKLVLKETTTVKAAAYDGNDWSPVTEVTFTKVLPDTITVAEAIEIGMALDSMQTSADSYVVEGYVINAGTFYTMYGNQSWYMADDANAIESDFYAYLCYPIEEDTLKVLNGDKVQLRGQLKKYYDRNNQQYIIEIRKGNASFVEMVEGDHSVNFNAEEITVAHALEIGTALADNAVTERLYTITGYVSAVNVKTVDMWSDAYQNQSFWIADDAGSTAQTNADGAFYVYRGKPDTKEAIPVGAKVQLICSIRKYVGSIGTTIENDGTNILVKVLELPSYVTINYEYDPLMGRVKGDTAVLTNTAITVTAIPNVGYHFTQWSDSITDNPRTIVLTQDTTFTAEFAKNEYTITTESSNNTWGTTAGDTTALYLDVIEISATPNYGYHFVRWNDNNTSNPRTITITEDKTYQATFAKNTYFITKVANSTQGSISGNSSAEYLDEVELTAVPNYGYHFTQWSDGVKDNPRTFVLTQDTTFTTEFALDRSGKCGNDLALNWNYDPEKHILTISGEGAFNENMQCGVEAKSAMTHLVIDKGVTSIGENAFSGCSYLSHLTIGESVTSIGNYVFQNCIGLTSIELPNSVTTIGNGIISGCTGLTSVTIPGSATNNQTTIAQNTANLKAVNAPASFFAVQESLWINCPKYLEQVTVNSGELNDNAFGVISRSYKTLKQLDIAAVTNTSLADEAFKSYYNLTSLALPEGLEYIDYMTVADCKSLQSIAIPASVTEIGNSAFEDCRSLSEVVFAENPQLERIGNWAFYNCHTLQNLTIPEGVTEIGDGAFYGCTYLEELNLPASVQSMGNNAFALCSKIKMMNVNALLPPDVEAKTFYEVSRTAPVYVPDESLEAYFHHPIWSELNIVGKSQAPSSISNIQSDNVQTTKILHNGQILILRGEKIYTLQGQEVR